MPIPKIEEIVAVAILGFRSGASWGDVYLEYKSEGETYYKMVGFKHEQMTVFWTHGSFHYPFNNCQGITKIYEPDYKKVLNGDYDHIKITPVKYKEKLGRASNILREMLEDV